jgi:acetyl-CoA carboxylase biotin carboxyl carrier protein
MSKFEDRLAKKNLKKSNGGSQSGAISTSPMNLNLLEQITQLMKSNDLNMVEVRDGDKRIILKRGAPDSPGSGQGFVPQYAPMPAQNAAAGASSAAGEANKSDDTSNLLQIKSPMVGTFYSSSSPDAKAFVSVGSTVDEETDVCIIEAMKVFNNIKAECSGTIAKVLVENGETVEFGQVLFLVKP